MNDNEIWKVIKNFEGYYEVSSRGRVRSVTRKIGPRVFRGRMLKQAFNSAGYPIVHLRKAKESFTPRVHRLVAETFIGPPPSQLFEVRHYDGNKLNNSVDNLLWGTRSENAFDRVRHGTNMHANRSHCPAGHSLQEPNVVGAMRKIGRRGCLACHLASGRFSANELARDHALWTCNVYYERIKKNFRTPYRDFQKDLHLHVANCNGCSNRLVEK